jgi:hypothetical protein
MTQTVIVLLVLAAAGAYIARRAWTAALKVKRAKDAPGCGSDCGCSPE